MLPLGSAGGVALDLARLTCEPVLQAAHRMARVPPGHDGVRITCTEHLLLVCLRNRALLDRQETRAALHPLGTQSERRKHAAAIGHATSRDHGNPYRIADRGNECHRGEFPHMAAGLGSLGDDGVGAQPLHPPGLRCTRHHGKHPDVGLLPHRDELGRASCTGGHHIDVQLAEKLRQLGGLGVHEHHVGAKRFVRHRAGLRHLFRHPVKRGPSTGDDPQAARLTHSRRKPCIGNARHRTLDDGCFDPQQLRHTRPHTHAPTTNRCRRPSCRPYRYPRVHRTRCRASPRHRR